MQDRNPVAHLACSKHDIYRTQGDSAARLTQERNQVRIAVRWVRVEREAETSASEPTVLDEAVSSDLLRTLKDRLGLDQVFVCS